ncbi:MAG TPA: tripartite tricarboxylate transporter substrate binding protein [Burkholderiales bacterium]|jgi:tripartite-type tricarboxylate transporter receptor subunit TctC|nr:tripartite tricarboxylate transporter substrate binding protein [Burkholderiales bacterium]
MGRSRTRRPDRRASLWTRTRRGAVASLLAAAALWAPMGWSADAYPSHPIRLISGFAPGGATDVAARSISVKLGELLGQSVFVENKPGGSGNIAAEMVARANPDGYNMYLANTTIAMPSLFKKLPFDASKDLVPMSMVGLGPSALVVNPELPVRSVKELIDLAKKQPGKLNYASGGIGNITHMTMELFVAMTGIEVMHVPYKGGAPSTVAIMGGETQFGFCAIASTVGPIKAGKVIPIAVSSKTRSQALPNVPTVAEAGVPGFDATSWYALMLPGGTPQPIVDKLSNAMIKALANKELQTQLINAGIEPVHGGSEEFSKYMASETVKWEKIIAARHITAD